MPSNFPTLTEKQQEAACRGEICPRCQSRNIKSVGMSPQYDAVNEHFDCQDCGMQWEGY